MSKTLETLENFRKSLNARIDSLAEIAKSEIAFHALSIKSQIRDSNFYHWLDTTDAEYWKRWQEAKAYEFEMNLTKQGN